MLNKILYFIKHPISELNRILFTKKIDICIEKYIKKREKNDFNIELAYNDMMQNVSIYDFKTKRQKDLCIFGTMPPEKSGIAEYNFIIFAKNSKKVDIFSKVISLTNYQYLLNRYNGLEKNFFVLENFSLINSKTDYKKYIFVLGNSSHNTEYFKMAYELKDNYSHKILYIHEAYIYGMLIDFLDGLQKSDLQKYNFISKKFLSEYRISTNKNKTSLINSYFGNDILFTLNATNITNIIVSNETSKKIIEEKVKNTSFENKLNISIVDLPIEILETTDKLDVKQNNELIIGTFGIPDNKRKLTNIIIDATNILNKRGIKTKCILCGFNINEYINKINKGSIKNCILFDSPQMNCFLEAMNSIDIGIQLRKNSVGESSGVISQLLGIGKKVITSKNFVSNNYSKYCYLIDNENLTGEKLADFIEECKEKENLVDLQEIKQKYTPQKILEKIISINNNN